MMPPNIFYHLTFVTVHAKKDTAMISLSP